jgi:hypothetical protein
VIFENGAYRLEPVRNGRGLDLRSAAGDLLVSLSLLAALDTTDAVDETLAVSPPQVDGSTIVVERRSTLWERAWLELRCLDHAVEVHTCVQGRGDLADVLLLGGRSLVPGAPLGQMPSGTPAQRLFSPNPEERLEPERDLQYGTRIGVHGDGEPGRQRWLFTPAPLYIALGGETDWWLDLAVAAPLDELRFVELAVECYAQSLSLRLDYDGHTPVDGEFRAPVLLLTTGVADPFAGLRRHRADLVERGHATAPAPRTAPAWWLEPIFCGWGAQCHLEKVDGGLARDHATQRNYDTFLAQLAEHDVSPGIVVLDDKWQATYGANEPDPGKWPDLASWIGRRHEAGQHVLLWWKAWDPEGVDPALCVRNPDGIPVALDPCNAATREFVRDMVERLLSPSGLDADGFKLDFTARTPAGRALAHAGGAWGIALLHELLAVFYAAAKEAKPDALVITHTVHPAFADVTDMIRLNDMLGGGDVVEQMTFRADVARAVLPELPIDTDDWRIPDKRSWRAFLEAKPQIGVPSLYYATHLDATGEELDEDDFASVRRVWDAWEARTR